MKRILVTGAAGYIGSVLVRRLSESGFQVTALDLQPLAVSSQEKNIRYIQGDVLDAELMTELLQNADAVIPLAALVGAPLCEQNPDQAWAVNHQAVSWMLKNKPLETKIIFPMTNNGYELEIGKDFADEHTPMRGLSIYTQSKLAAEREVLAGGGISLRLASLFGVSPKHRSDLLLHCLLDQAVRIGTIEIYEASFRRSFVHIEDVVRAFLFSIRNAEKMSGKAWNVAGKFNNISKRELATAIQKQFSKISIVAHPEPLDPDQRDCFISTERLQKLGFEACGTIEQGISELLANYPVALTTEAVILAGGEGTRLRPVLEGLPKALAPVAGRPFIFHLLDQIIEAGISRAVLCLGYEAGKIQETLGNEYKTLQLEYSVEPEILGTGGALRFALPKILKPNVIVLNGDSLVESGIFQLLIQKSSQEQGIGLVQYDNGSSFGSVEFQESGQVSRFAEKKANTENAWINAGIYFLHRKTVERISAFQKVSLEFDLFPALVREKKLWAYPLKGKFFDIGTPESLTRAQAFFEATALR